MNFISISNCQTHTETAATRSVEQRGFKGNLLKEKSTGCFFSVKHEKPVKLLIWKESAAPYPG